MTTPTIPAALRRFLDKHLSAGRLPEADSVYQIAQMFETTEPSSGRSFAPRCQRHRLGRPLPRGSGRSTNSWLRRHSSRLSRSLRRRVT
jgi:hypothetical protein